MFWFGVFVCLFFVEERFSDMLKYEMPENKVRCSLARCF